MGVLGEVMNTYIPTIKDIYMVSYITMRGWKLADDDRWEKEGCVRPLTFNEEESNRYYSRNNMNLLYTGKDFLLEDAYYFELGKEEQ